MGEGVGRDGRVAIGLGGCLKLALIVDIGSFRVVPRCVVFITDT